MDIRAHLHLPASISAILWDMDGVLIDSLGFDVANCSRLLHRVTGFSVNFNRKTIEDGFALSPDDFWKYLAAQANLNIDADQLQNLIALYEEERRQQAFPVLAGVTALLETARKSNFKLAVVSNNPKQDVELILQNCGLLEMFDVVLGNDAGTMHKKPAPDTYLAAATLLGIEIKNCAVVEDSLIGAQAGCSASAFTIGVASGGTPLNELQNSGLCDYCCQTLDMSVVESHV